MERVFVVSTCEVFESEIETSRYVFKNKKDAEEKFASCKEHIDGEAEMHFIIIEDVGCVVHSGEGVRVQGKDSYSIHQAYAASQWEMSVLLEELPLN